MRLNKIDNFDKRAASSASAKAALLDKFRTRPDLTDPEFQERQKARADAAAAKIAREVERKAAKEAEIARLEAERKAAQAEKVRLAIEAEKQTRLSALTEKQRMMREKLEAARAARKRSD
jgi:phage terminase large subunit-like protein